MSRINTEFFIARRLANGPSRESKNVMVRIASLTVAISIAVMIISMAVIAGFRHQITDKLIGFGAHLQIVNLDGNSSLETTPIKLDPQLIAQIEQVNGFKGAHPFAVKGGILKTDQTMQGIMLKGVNTDYDWSFFSKNLIAGELPDMNDSIRSKDILISRTIADMMELEVDAKVEMLFIQSDRPVRRDRFKVSGIYDSGFEELDKMVIPTDIRNVQRLSGWSAEQVTGYEITTTNFSDLETFYQQVYSVMANTDMGEDQNLMVVDIKTKFPNLFDWLSAHNVNAAVILTIMLLVALFNMISALLIILLERTSMIGILKSLGMKNGAIQKIFIIRSSFIIIKGLVWGNIIGIGLSLIQQYTHILKLDQAGYFLSEVPIELGWWIVWLNIGSFALLLALLTIPTMIISYVKPEKTIRYQ